MNFTNSHRVLPRPPRGERVGVRGLWLVARLRPAIRVGHRTPRLVPRFIRVASPLPIEESVQPPTGGRGIAALDRTRRPVARFDERASLNGQRGRQGKRLGKRRRHGKDRGPRNRSRHLGIVDERGFDRPAPYGTGAQKHSDEKGPGKGALPLI